VATPGQLDGQRRGADAATVDDDRGAGWGLDRDRRRVIAQRQELGRDRRAIVGAGRVVEVALVVAGGSPALAELLVAGGDVVEDVGVREELIGALVLGDRRAPVAPLGRGLAAREGGAGLVARGAGLTDGRAGDQRPEEERRTRESR
jgi:hypothetical protein